MLAVNLHSNWKMRTVGSEEYLEALVPGSVYNDLLLHNKMEDPYYRDNELKALKLMEADYEYITHFPVDDAMLACDEVILHFDGLDTVADVYLNGVHLGHVENMHRIWEYSAKSHLKSEDNELKIIFHSPTNFIKEAYAQTPMDGTTDAMVGFPLLRKAHCMFGWDWGPRLPDAGIWREVKLLGVNSARFESVYIRQKHEGGQVFLSFQVDIVETTKDTPVPLKPEGRDGFTYRVTVTDPGGLDFQFEGSEGPIKIENPELWWPNGYGEQPLYKILVELCKDGEVRDIWEKRIGLRTMTMKIEKDEFGESFAHVVNGVPIFAMGADYIPEDNILSRTNKDRTYLLLKQCKAANFNSIRVWGGGHYPGDDFWDACDEMGFVVWEDFMFACAVYALTDDFEENVKAEFVDNIRRIRHHASLGLWCGNNEMEMFVDMGLWSKDPKAKSDYVKLYEYIIPKIVKEHDPQTFYWPASPSSGGAFDAPNDEKRGDVHYWDVWHGNKPFTEYRKFNFRYVSEFGFQSFPSLKTVETFTEPGDRNIFSYVMEKHQRNNAANGKIMNYMGQTFLYPNDFATTLYASQLLQADAIRYGVEHFRRIRGCCMGTIYWQLNDCWPVASWASIDYFNRWKALHYYAKRFFAPVMISCREEGILTQDTNTNAEPYEVKKSIALCVANETLADKTVLVRWSLRDAKSRIKRQEETTITVEKLTSKWLDEVVLGEADLYSDYVAFEALVDGVLVSSGTVIFSIPKHFGFVDPQLSVQVEGDELIVSAQAYARSVEILNGEDTMLLEDNYFDMNAGERRVKVISGIAENLQIRSVYNIR